MDSMNKQVRDLIDAGYVTRKQAAAILGKGDGGNITKLCKDAGVKFIEIPFGTKTTTLFVGVEVVRLFEKMDKQSRPKQEEIFKGVIPKPRMSGPSLLDVIPAMQSKRMLLVNESEIMETLGRIEAMLTALLKRGEAL